MLSKRRITTSAEPSNELVARSALIKALRKSEDEELSLVMHMRRVFDPRGLHILRSLRRRIDSLKARLANGGEG